LGHFCGSGSAGFGGAAAVADALLTRLRADVGDAFGQASPLVVPLSLARGIGRSARADAAHLIHEMRGLPRQPLMGRGEFGTQLADGHCLLAGLCLGRPEPSL
jgi:hypothetical protein